MVDVLIGIILISVIPTFLYFIFRTVASWFSLTLRVGMVLKEFPHSVLHPRNFLKAVRWDNSRVSLVVSLFSGIMVLCWIMSMPSKPLFHIFHSCFGRFSQEGKSSHLYFMLVGRGGLVLF